MIRKSKNSVKQGNSLPPKPLTTQSLTVKPISRSCKIPQFKSRYLPMKMAQNELCQPLDLVSRDRCNNIYVNSTRLNRLLALALRNYRMFNQKIARTRTQAMDNRMLGLFKTLLMREERLSRGDWLQTVVTNPG